MEEFRLGTSAKFAAILLLPIALSACAGSDDGKPITYTDDRGVSNQPFPNNYRTEVLAFMKTYLNNPVGVRDAVDGRAGPAHRRRAAALCHLPALQPRANPTAAIASRANARSSLSMAGSTAWSKTPASPAPARSTRRSRNWKR